EFAGIADHCVHRHAADARAVGRGRFVGWTFVNGGGTTGVGTELGVGEIDQIGVVIVGGPVLDVVGPGLAAGGGLGFAVVIDEQIIVVVRVKGPGERELFDVIGALGGFGARFRFAQSRKEEARKNRDDRNDDEEFDQREGALRHGGIITQQCSHA